MKKQLLIAVGLLLATPAGGGACEPVYRLYRTWVPQTNLPGRVHVATFDAGEQDSDGRPETSYNGTVCEIARSLFQGQPGVQIVFWCKQLPAR